MIVCVECKNEENKVGFFCSQCGTLLPATQYNYFELFALNHAEQPNIHRLNTILFELQNKLHPDRFVTHDKSVQERAIAHSEIINEAYQTLKNPLKRLNYMLQLAGVEFESIGTDVSSKYALEAFELQERAAELNDAAERDEFIVELESKQKQLIDKCHQELAAANIQAAVESFAQIKFLNSLLSNLNNAR